MEEENNPVNDAEDTFKLDVVRVKLVKEAPLYSELPLQTPYEAAATIGELLCDMDREVVCVVNLQSDLKPINVTFASVGSLNEALVHPREILKSSILSNAASIMLIHSHPSGNLLPSKVDTMMTDRLNSICAMVGIQLVDHVIVGGDNKEFFSFKEKGMIDNPTITYSTDYKNFSFSNSLVAERGKAR
jgi:DNA repair protein RadC